MTKKIGVALRAGLLAALKPRKRVFPLAGCHPLTQTGGTVQPTKAANLVGANRLVLLLLAVHFPS